MGNILHCRASARQMQRRNRRQYITWPEGNAAAALSASGALGSIYAASASRPHSATAPAATAIVAKPAKPPPGKPRWGRRRRARLSKQNLLKYTFEPKAPATFSKKAAQRLFAAASKARFDKMEEDDDLPDPRKKEADRIKAEREAARKAARCGRPGGGRVRGGRAREKSAKMAQKVAQRKVVVKTLWARMRRASEQASGNGDYTDAAAAAAVVNKLKVVDAARRVQAGECEKAALIAYKAAQRRVTAREKSAALLARGEEEEAKDASLGADKLAAQEAAAAAKNAAAAAAAEKAEAQEHLNMDDAPPADTTAEEGSNSSLVEGAAAAIIDLSATAPASTTSATSASAPTPSPPQAAAPAASSPRRSAKEPPSPERGAKRPTSARGEPKVGRSGGFALPDSHTSSSSSSHTTQHQQEAVRIVPRRSTVYEFGMQPPPTTLPDALLGLPSIIPVTPLSQSDMRNSLRPVLYALNHDVHASESEIDAARQAFASWRKELWLDSRTNEWKPKEKHSWTIEQYGLVHFSSLYARKLHVPRVAAARQITLWLLQCSPGLPSDEPLGFADLGAGTSAACLGARLALRDHGGDEQPYKTFPIDVASSSARFAAAFKAMTKAELYGRSALLPGQEPWQYMMAEEGVEKMTRSLFEQLIAKGEAQPHIMLASFSLHYLQKDQRDAYFKSLAKMVTRPMLLVIIKGVGNNRPSPDAIRSVYFALHYVVHRAEKHPRVVEAHVCLILPGEASGGARLTGGCKGEGEGEGGRKGEVKGALPPLVIPEDAANDLPPSDLWMLQTYATIEKRCKREGIRTGVTYFEESWL